MSPLERYPFCLLQLLLQFWITPRQAASVIVDLRWGWAAVRRQTFFTIQGAFVLNVGAFLLKGEFLLTVRQTRFPTGKRALTTIASNKTPTENRQQRSCILQSCS